MKRLLTALTVLITLIGSAGTSPAGIGAKPYISVSFTPEIIDLGTLPFPLGTYDPPAVLTVRVESNCVHGPILASITGLKHHTGGTITPDRIFIKSQTTGGFVPMVKPVAVSETTMGSHDILLNFRVENKFQDMAGKYTGTITLTITPPSTAR
jgi:hypothetical protein